MRRNKHLKSVIYVNYSPYENSGKILDFLVENFEKVFLFSLGFHMLGNKKHYNRLLIYVNGKLREQKSLIQIPIGKKFIFFLLPLKSLITFVQILTYSFWLKNKYGKVNFYFTVNAFTAWIGTLTKKMGFVNKTIFWVWDYYPPFHENKIIRLMRYVYWQFDKISSHSDYVAYVNQRLIDLRKAMGVLPKNAKFPIIPIGTDKFDVKLQTKNDVVFGFIGVLKKSHGLDIIFNNAQEIMKNFPNARFEVIGSGPDEVYFKRRAKNSSIPTKFYGYLEGETFNEVLKKCSIGIAAYVPDKSNVSHYGDPGKIKRYLSLGIPAILTNVIGFSKEVENARAGVIVDYDNSPAFINAIKRIMSNYTEYSENALKLSSRFYYKDIYPSMFKSLVV